MKKKTIATVISQKEIAPGIFEFWLDTELAMYTNAGKFIGVYTKDPSKLLPRPISICEVADDWKSLRLVYRVTSPTAGTAEFSKLKEGENVEILGPLGNGYLLTDIFGEDLAGVIDANVILLGGGIGIPPMLETAKELYNHGLQSTVIAGYRDSNIFLNQDLGKYAELKIASEDGSVGTQGNVLDVIVKENLQPTVILACGPMPMLRAIKRFVSEKQNTGSNIKAFVSLEERMACGVGACLGCVTKTKDVDEHSHVNNTRICTDGPVFDVDILEL